MKKSSRDYRRNNRKKWININRKRAMCAISAVSHATQMRLLLSSPWTDPITKRIGMIEIAMNAAQSILSIINEKDIEK